VVIHEDHKEKNCKRNKIVVDYNRGCVRSASYICGSMHSPKSFHGKNFADGRSLHVEYLKGKPLVIFFSLDIGEPAENLIEIFRFWKWKGLRLQRVGKVV
jgi:hypothetical protein